MNKKNLWFVSLCSIILILCIYYITIPDDIMDTNEAVITSSDTLVNAYEVSSLVALRVSKDEEVMEEINELQNIIVDSNKNTDEKNLAYEKLKNINYKNSKEQSLEKIIKDEFKYDCYVKINNDEISIVISSNEHNKEIANNIIKRIQSVFTTKKYITVKFQ